MDVSMYTVAIDDQRSSRSSKHARNDKQDVPLACRFEIATQVGDVTTLMRRPCWSNITTPSASANSESSRARATLRPG